MIELYEHQKRSLDQTADKNRVAYYLDMGLGKTFVGSEKAASFPEKILVVCQYSKIQDWIEHFQQNYPFTVFDLTEKKQLTEYLVTVGKCVGVINYDLVFRRSDIAHISNFTLMLDESSLIQNETAKRSKFILKLNPKNVILLSGTPTSGKYEKLWSQLHLLGWNISKKLYFKQYVIQEWIDDGDSGFKIPIVVGYKNVDRLKEKLASYGAVFMKTEEAFELPEQVDIPIKVPASSDYRRFMRKDVVTVNRLDTGVTGWKTTMEAELIGDTSLTKRLYARMLCGQYNENKLQAFEDLIQGTNERLIVFYNFKEEFQLLLQIAANHGKNISFVNGEKKDLSSYEQFDDSITFIQYQAGAMGLNLQKANQIVYFTLPERPDLFEQSKKRIHRIGQEKRCFYYYLLCENSVELDILENLKMRKEYNDALFQKYDEETKRKDEHDG